MRYSNTCNRLLRVDGRDASSVGIVFSSQRVAERNFMVDTGIFLDVQRSKLLRRLGAVGEKVPCLE